MILIGITAGMTASAAAVNRDYIDAVLRCGAAPVLIPPLGSDAAADRIPDALDGLMLTGGGDVDPACYGEERIPACGPSDGRRDATEILLCRRAIERGIPVLGICRGCQVLNAAMGGTLYQDIASQYSADLEHSRSDDPAGQVHTVAVRKGTRLWDILGRETPGVNSRHHQAVKTPGRGLIVSARAPDGTVEGIEGNGDGFVLGVQWHPESLLAAGREGAMEIFSAFAAACTERANK